MKTIELGDITLKKLAERAEQENCSVDELVNRLLDSPKYQQTDSLYHLILEQTGDTVGLFDLNLRYLHINPVMEALTGIPASNMIGKTDRELGMPEKQVSDWKAAWQEVINTRREKFITFEFDTMHGHRHYESRLTPILNGDGEVQYLASITRDITERVRVEDALLRNQQVLDKAQAVANLGIWELNLQTNETTWSDEFYRICGLEPGSVKPSVELGFTLIHPDDRDKAAAAFEKSQKSGEPYHIEKRIVHPNGVIRWVISQGEVTYDEQGRPLILIGTFLDITERKEVEEALRRSEARLRSLLDSQTAFVVRIDLNGHYTYYNQPFAERYRWLAPDLTGKPVLETIIEEDQHKAEETTQACLADPGKPFQVVLRKITEDNSYFWTVWEFAAVQDSTGKVTEIQCIGFDITKEKLAEEALRESEARYKLLTELMSDYAISVRVDADGKMTVEWVVGAFEEITGYPRTIYSDNPKVTIIHPDDRERARSDMLRTTQGHGEHTISEYRILNKKGGYRWIRVSRMPVWDENEGRVIRFYSAAQDITKIKEAEQNTLQKERLRASLRKERELNTMIQKAISELSHDLRTPLTVIANTKEMLQMYFDRFDEEERRQKLNRIDKQLRYALELLDDVTLATKGSLSHRIFKPTMVNLAALCQVTISEVQETMSRSQQIIFETDGQIETVFVDETLVSRILLNLLSNAIKFSPDSGEIRLQLNRRENWIILQVSDQGIGINEEDQKHIFEPFYRAETVKEIGGTGLGLSIVQDCVSRHEGQISVSSVPRQGTTFTVEIPLLEEPINEE